MTSRLVLILILVLVCVSASSAFERVDNPSEPRDGFETLSLSEVWRVGGEDDDTIFGLVPRVETDSGGNVYILDSQMCTVSVFDRGGTFLHTLFREGEGPGEVVAPRDMMVMGDGRVGLIQEFPGGVSFVNADGSPAGRIKVGGTDGSVSSLTGCQASGDMILLTGTHRPQSTDPSISVRNNYLERLGVDGRTIAQFAVNHTHYDFTDFRFIEREHMPSFWFCFTAGPDGVVYVLPDRDRYAIETYAPDGTPLRVISRAYEPLERTETEFQQMVGLVESAMSGVPFETTIEMERSAGVMNTLNRSLQVHADGSLWVLSSRGIRSRLTGVMSVFDVFDQKGVFVRQVAFDAPHEGQDVGVFLSGPDHVLVVKGYFESLAAQFGNGSTLSVGDEEPATPEVICYRIDR